MRAIMTRFANRGRPGVGSGSSLGQALRPLKRVIVHIKSQHVDVSPAFPSEIQKLLHELGTREV